MKKKNKEQSSIKIESAKPENARDIAKIWQKTWIETYPNENQDLVKDAMDARKVKEQEQFIEQCLIDKNMDYLVAKKNGMLVGFGYSFKYDQFQELKSLYVLPAYQGQGIGFKFWNEFLKFFDKEKPVIVKVASYNKNAIAFYKKLGFRITDKISFDSDIEMIVNLRKD